MIINESKSFELNGCKYSHGHGHYYKNSEEILGEDYKYAATVAGASDDLKLDESEMIIDETAGLTLKTFDDPRGIGVIINNQKYVYLTRDKKSILVTFNKMRRYSDGRALAWLKKQTNNNYIKL